MTRGGGRRPHAGGSLAIVCLLVLTGFLGLSLSSPRAAAATPQLAILTPTEGAVVDSGMPVTVRLLVSNFSLVQPGRVGQVATPGEGHANVYLDGEYVRLLTSTEPFGLAVTSGPHTILVELVLDNGSALNPAVRASVHVTATQGPAAGVPSIEIITPAPGEKTGHGFWLTLRISNFTLVPPQGQPNAPNEGHIRILVLGTIVEELSSAEPVILVAMPDGDVNLTVRLVNNDNTPLNPDVAANVDILVAASSTVTLPLILNGGVTLLLGFTLVVLIIRRRGQAKRRGEPPVRDP